VWPEPRVVAIAASKKSLRRILGIDPGSVITGFGIIETDGVRDFHVHHGAIRIAGDDLPEKLGFILHSIGQLIDEWQPAEVSVEQVFVSKNPMSALKLGQARGAAICAAVQRGLPVAEYSPRTIKQAAVGYGSADKEQMQEMIRVLLTLEQRPPSDAADGLAAALCHAHSSLPHAEQGVVKAVRGATGGGRRRHKRWSSVP